MLIHLRKFFVVKSSSDQKAAADITDKWTGEVYTVGKWKWMSYFHALD